MTRCDKTAIALALTPALLAPFALTLLPERIPTHWNLAGQADGWGSPLGFLLFFQVGMGIMLILYACQFRFLRKQPDFARIGKLLMTGIMGFFTLLMLFAFGLSRYASQFGPPPPWVVGAVFPGTNLLLLLLLYHYTPRMFPGQPENAAITRKILFSALLFFALLAALAAATVSGARHNADRIVLCGIGWLFAVIGNLMPKLKTNPWAGIRVKWTMEDPEIWYKTHRLGGRVWVAGGVLLAVAPLLLPPGITKIVFLADLAVLVLIPTLYAWHLARRKRQLNRAGQGGPDTPRSA